MEKKISVVIPNYNGKEILKKTLPKVIENCPNCQIIVVDDASTDESVNFLRKNFNKINIIQLKKNKGFAGAVNEGVERAIGDLILLLNSDVSPRVDFLQSALSHFKDAKTLAVGLADYSHEDKKIVIRGRGGGSFEKGFLKHFALPVTSGKTLWVSGGSGLFDRRKFLELGGFDTNFAPFYWEDIDLSFRAWQIGYVCLFEPKSKVDHFHKAGAIQKLKSRFLIKSASYKNQFIFVWKNISDYSLIIQHLLWLPYHFTKALLTLDIAFFAGFLWALVKIPSLIVSCQLSVVSRQLSDREVLNKFAKP